MATSLHSRASSPVRGVARRGLIIAAALLVIVLLAWELSSQNLALVALATAPVGAIGLFLVRERGTLAAAVADAGPLLDDWGAFKREIDRSRRHERALALAVASLPDTTLGGGLLADTITRARSHMRSTDLLLYDGSGFWLLMPEAHREEATTAIRRIANSAPETKSAVWRLVVFPHDALTIGALISELDRTPPVELDARPTASAA